MKRRLTLIAPAILVCALVIGAAGATVHGGLPEVNSLPMLDMDMVVVAEPPVVGGVITVTVTVRDHLGTPPDRRSGDPVDIRAGPARTDHPGLHGTRWTV